MVPTPFSKISESPISPSFIKIDGDEAKKSFLDRFGQDEKSYQFFQKFVKYCTEENNDMWIKKITDETIGVMFRDYLNDFNLYDTVLLKKGFIIDKIDYFEITLDLIIYAFICSPVLSPENEKMPQICGKHINFNAEGRKKLRELLEKEVYVGHPADANISPFLEKLIEKMLEFPTVVLTEKSFSAEYLIEIAEENNLNYETSISWAESHKLISKETDGTYKCDGLLMLLYLCCPSQSDCGFSITGVEGASFEIYPNKYFSIHSIGKVVITGTVTRGEVKNGDAIQIISVSGNIPEKVEKIEIEHVKTEKAIKGDKIGICLSKISLEELKNLVN